MELNVIHQALNRHKPDIETRYKNLIRFQFDSLVRQFGPHLKGIYNSGMYRAFKNISPFLIQKKSPESTIFNSVDTWEVNEMELDKEAPKYADIVIRECLEKLNQKLGELEHATCEMFSGFQSFRITGQKKGHRVDIEQHMIINVSKNGVVFNQFPSRIRVDGKSYSEAKYKDFVR